MNFSFTKNQDYNAKSTRAILVIFVIIKVYVMLQKAIKMLLDVTVKMGQGIQIIFLEKLKI